MNRAEKLIIVADDLTGAADTASRCHFAGLPATILTAPDIQDLPDGAIAINTDTRHRTGSDAFSIVAKLSRSVRRYGNFCWYKKIDSTLRGNIGAELDGLFSVLSSAAEQSAAPKRIAIICPALPVQERGIVDGRLTARQISVPDIHFPTLLREQSCRKVGEVALSDVRRDVDHLTRTMKQLIDRGVDYIIVDGTSESDLRMIRDAAGLASANPIYCGSAGLAQMIAEWLALEQVHAVPAIHRAHGSAFLDRADSGSIVIIVGSASLPAQRQMGYLLRQADVTSLEIKVDRSITVDQVRQVSDSSLILLHLPAPRSDAKLDGPKARAMAKTLGNAAEKLYFQLRPQLMILVGGDTSMAVAERLMIGQLDIVCELLPGIPLAVGHAGDGIGQAIILKSGNHGIDNTLVKLIEIYRSLNYKKS